MILMRLFKVQLESTDWKTGSLPCSIGSDPDLRLRNSVRATQLPLRRSQATYEQDALYSCSQCSLKTPFPCPMI